MDESTREMIERSPLPPIKIGDKEWGDFTPTIKNKMVFCTAPISDQGLCGKNRYNHPTLKNTPLKRIYTSRLAGVLWLKNNLRKSDLFSLLGLTLYAQCDTI